MKIRIGELAKIASCPVVTIRFYEKEGLLKKPERTSGNYRVYSDADIERLRFIKHCRSHGMGIAEIRALLELRDAPAGPDQCLVTHRLVERLLARVDEKINSLLALKKELLALARAGTACDGPGGCAVLRALGEDDGCLYCENAQHLRNSCKS